MGAFVVSDWIWQMPEPTRKEVWVGYKFIWKELMNQLL